MKKFNALALSLLLGAAAAAPAQALDTGDWTVRAGLTNIFTESYGSDPVITAATGPIPGTAVGPDDAASLGLTVGYAFSPNVGVELLAAWPFKHDVQANATLRGVLQGQGLAGTRKIGEVTQLPPTLSLVYTFQPDSDFRPSVGGGINWFITYDEEVKGDLATAGYTDLDIDNSFGLALQAGFDLDVNEDYFLNASVRWIDIDVDAEVTGGALGTINANSISIDPVVFSLMLGTTF
jgi:outer membrane protein